MRTDRRFEILSSGILPGALLRQFAAGGTPTLEAFDGNLSRNAGVRPWTIYNDLRVSRRINFGERISVDLIADMFNLANKTTLLT